MFIKRRLMSGIGETIRPIAEIDRTNSVEYGIEARAVRYKGTSEDLVRAVVQARP